MSKKKIITGQLDLLSINEEFNVVYEPLVMVKQREIRDGDIVKCIDNIFGYDGKGKVIHYYLTKGKKYRVKYTMECNDKIYCCIEDDNGNEACYRSDRFN